MNKISNCSWFFFCFCFGEREIHRWNNKARIRVFFDQVLYLIDLTTPSSLIQLLCIFFELICLCVSVVILAMFMLNWLLLVCCFCGEYISVYLELLSPFSACICQTWIMFLYISVHFWIRSVWQRHLIIVIRSAQCWIFICEGGFSTKLEAGLVFRFFALYF